MSFSPRIRLNILWHLYCHGVCPHCYQKQRYSYEISYPSTELLEKAEIIIHHGGEPGYLVLPCIAKIAQEYKVEQSITTSLPYLFSGILQKNENVYLAINLNAAFHLGISPFKGFGERSLLILTLSPTMPLSENFLKYAVQWSQWHYLFLAIERYRRRAALPKTSIQKMKDFLLRLREHLVKYNGKTQAITGFARRVILRDRAYQEFLVRYKNTDILKVVAPYKSCAPGYNICYSCIDQKVYGCHKVAAFKEIFVDAPCFEFLLNPDINRLPDFLECVSKLPCQNCKYNVICGCCPLNSFIENGRLKIRDQAACQMAAILYEWYELWVR